jgi:hypothetical protein
MRLIAIAAICVASFAVTPAVAGGNGKYDLFGVGDDGKVINGQIAFIEGGRKNIKSTSEVRWIIHAFPVGSPQNGKIEKFEIFRERFFCGRGTASLEVGATYYTDGSNETFNSSEIRTIIPGTMLDSANKIACDGAAPRERLSLTSPSEAYDWALIYRAKSLTVPSQ